MKKEDKNKLLENAFIPKEWWDLCEIKDGAIITPTRDILYKNGLATEGEYQEWLKAQNPVEQPDKTRILSEKLDSVTLENQQLKLGMLELSSQLAKITLIK